MLAVQFLSELVGSRPHLCTSYGLATLVLIDRRARWAATGYLPRTGKDQRAIDSMPSAGHARQPGHRISQPRRQPSVPGLACRFGSGIRELLAFGRADLGGVSSRSEVRRKSLRRHENQLPSTGIRKYAAGSSGGATRTTARTPSATRGTANAARGATATTRTSTATSRAVRASV